MDVEDLLLCFIDHHDGDDMVTTLHRRYELPMERVNEFGEVYSSLHGKLTWRTDEYMDEILEEFNPRMTDSIFMYFHDYLMSLGRDHWYEYMRNPIEAWRKNHHLYMDEDGYLKEWETFFTSDE